MPCRGPNIDEINDAETTAEPYYLLLYVNELKPIRLIADVGVNEIVRTVESIKGFGNYRTLTFDDATLLLCNTIKDFTDAEQQTILYNGRDPMSRRLATWWEEHERLDELRNDSDRRTAAERIARAEADAAYFKAMQRQGF